MDKFIAHILVVDDDDGIRSLVKKYLNENKFLVTTAENAENALEKVKIIKFDLIVLDIMMPGKSGLEFLKENKKKLDTPGKTFSREDIGQLINLDKERSIDVIITRLRKKIEIDPKNPKFLQTIRGAGYVLWIE